MEQKMVIDRSASSKKASRELSAFARNLQLACDEFGFSMHEASHLIAERTGDSWRKVYAHIKGERGPRGISPDELTGKYTEALKISKERRALARKNDASLTLRVPLHMEANAADPLLRDIPFPGALAQGEALFLWRLADGDFSMIGEGYNILPGTYLICDAAAAIEPGHIVLCKPKGFDHPIVRLFKASRAFSTARAFELLSPNPLFDAIHVKRKAECQALGRVRFSINQW